MEEGNSLELVMDYEMVQGKGGNVTCWDGWDEKKFVLEGDWLTCEVVHLIKN